MLPPETSRTHFDTYAAAIREVLARFQSQVGSIKSPSPGLARSWRKRACWVKDGSSTSRRLANLLVIEANEDFLVKGREKSYKFKEWIDDDMAEMAVNKTKHYEGGNVETVDKTEIDFHPSPHYFATDK